MSHNTGAETMVQQSVRSVLVIPCCPTGEKTSISTREMRPEVPRQRCGVSSLDNVSPRRCRDANVGKLVAPHWVWESWNFPSVKSRAVESRERVLDIVKIEVGTSQLHKSSTLYCASVSPSAVNSWSCYSWYLQFGFRMSLYISM